MTFNPNSIKIDSKTLLIVLLLLVCLGIAAYNFFSIAEIGKINDDIADIEADILRNSAEITELNAIREKEDSINRVIELLPEKIPESTRQSDIINQITALCAGMKLSGITFGAVRENEVAFELPISLTVSGSYAQVLGLMSELTGTNRMYTISGIAITASEDSPDITSTVSVSSYYGYKDGYK